MIAKLEGERPHVVEVYSPPRVTDMAEQWGLVPGLAMDITTVDPTDGEPWDFNVPEKARKAEAYVREAKPLLLVGSPVCTAFSQLQTLNRSKMGEMEYQRALEH